MKPIGGVGAVTGSWTLLCWDTAGLRRSRTSGDELDSSAGLW